MQCQVRHITLAIYFELSKDAEVVFTSFQAARFLDDQRVFFKWLTLESVFLLRASEKCVCRRGVSPDVQNGMGKVG